MRHFSPDSDAFTARKSTFSASSAGGGITRAAFDAKVDELANTMKAHGVSGYGNVLKGKDAVLAHLGKTGNTEITQSMLGAVVQKGISGVPAGKTVHKWLEQIVTTGDCPYIAHVKTKYGV